MNTLLKQWPHFSDCVNNFGKILSLLGKCHVLEALPSYKLLSEHLNKFPDFSVSDFSISVTLNNNSLTVQGSLYRVGINNHIAARHILYVPLIKGLVSVSFCSLLLIVTDIECLLCA